MKNKFYLNLKSLLRPVVLVSGAALFLQSCVKDNFDFDKISDVKYNPEFAIPLVYSSLSTDDILVNIKDAGGVVRKESDKSLTVVYKKNFISVNANSLTTIPSQSTAYVINAGTLVINAGAPAFGNSVLVNQQQILNFSMLGINLPNNPLLVDSITFKSGRLDFSLSSDLHNSGQVLITIPGAKKNGAILSQIIPLNYSGSVPVNASASIDLTGYTFDMTNNSTGTNQVVINYAISVVGSGIAPNLVDDINVTTGFNDTPDFSKVCGNVGQHTISNYKDTMTLSIFKNSLGAASFALLNPSVKVIVHNSFGIPLDIDLMQLDGDDGNGNTFPIPNTTPFALNVSTPALNQMGQVLVDTTKLDNTNSQIASVVSNMPKYVEYHLTATSNAGLSSQNNFMLDTSRFDADLLVELPLHGVAEGFTMTDTLPLSIGEELADNVESGLLRLYNSNGLPIDLNLQVYFTDSNYVKLDSLIANPAQFILNSGVVNVSTGKVITPTATKLDILFDRNRLKKLAACKYIVIKAAASTTNNGTVNIKVYSDDALEVKLGLQLNVDVKLK